MDCPRGCSAYIMAPITRRPHPSLNNLNERNSKVVIAEGTKTAAAGAVAGSAGMSGGLALLVVALVLEEAVLVVLREAICWCW